MQLGILKRIYRADGQLGFTYCYQGDFGICQRMVAEAPVEAMKSQDVATEIFFYSTTASGYSKIKMFPDSERYARTAIQLSATFSEVAFQGSQLASCWIH